MKNERSRKTAFYLKQIKTRCHVCGKIGHRKEDCWESESNKDKRPILEKKLQQKQQKSEKNEKGTKAFKKFKYCMLEM